MDVAGAFQVSGVGQMPPEREVIVEVKSMMRESVFQVFVARSSSTGRLGFSTRVSVAAASGCLQALADHER